MRQNNTNTLTHLLFMGMFLLSFPILSAPAVAQEQACPEAERACIIGLLAQTTKDIEQVSWRDQTYRELAKTLAAEGRYDDAMALIADIETPDTRAMTIRGIGMELAENKEPDDMRDKVFGELRKQAESIEHSPSYAIALTYIAMGQAFAGDNQGAWDTAAAMENEALRFKAYGETAEIQAEGGDLDAAMKSISFISDENFANKAYSLVSKLLAGRGDYIDALHAAQMISNDYKKASALQAILNTQAKAKPEQESATP